MHGDADGAGLVGDGAADRLADPPRGVRGELVAALVLELVHRAHQADVAFLDQVQEAEAAVGVALGDGDHEAQVRLHERTLGDLALLDGLLQLTLLGGVEALGVGLLLEGGLAGFDGLGEADFVVLGEECVLTDVGEIKTNQVFFVAVNAILRHVNSVLCPSGLMTEQWQDTDPVSRINGSNQAEILRFFACGATPLRSRRLLDCRHGESASQRKIHQRGRRS